jgi:acyl-coenzyme A thioesterase PaaI-like protein
VLEFTVENLTTEEVERLRQVYEPLTKSVRELIDATIRSEVDAEAVAAAKAEIDSATARLRSAQRDGAFGVRFTNNGDRMPWGNAVIGLRNPIAPPLVVNQDPSGKVWTTFHLGAAYEGPPGHVHGGIGALVLDHLLGEAAADGENPRLTGTISFRYVRATRLGNLYAEAAIVRTEGVKTYAVGHLADDEGVTIEAEGVFILPRWAREATSFPARPATQ